MIPPSGGAGMKFGSGLHKVPTSDADWNREPVEGEGEAIRNLFSPPIARIAEYRVTEVVTCAYTFTDDERFLAHEKGKCAGRLGLLRSRLQVRRGGRPPRGRRRRRRRHRRAEALAAGGDCLTARLPSCCHRRVEPCFAGHGVWQMRLRPRRLFYDTLCALLVLVALADPARTEEALRGVALVIGQSAYKSLPALPNAADDARAIDRLLSDLGFDVDAVPDGDRRRLDRAFERFLEDAADADVALVYYAGHGVEAGGENYIVPVDAASPHTGGVVADLIPVSLMLAELQRKAPIAIVLLDACRDNPYPPGTLVAAAGDAAIPISAAGLGQPRGAASLRNTGPETLGAVVGFAAEPGQATLDGQAGANNHMPQPC